MALLPQFIVKTQIEHCFLYVYHSNQILAGFLSNTVILSWAILKSNQEPDNTHQMIKILLETKPYLWNRKYVPAN